MASFSLIWTVIATAARNQHPTLPCSCVKRCVNRLDMKIRILLCDDASFIRDLIKRNLRKLLPQSEILDASDGKKAQAILNRQPIDLIISDWEMPGLSGEELLQWVRAEPRLATTPFIMITSLGGKENIMKAVQAGVSDYLGKPFTPEELMQKVNKALVKA